MTTRPLPNPIHRLQPAAEQAAHPKSGPRRRPHELPRSVVTHAHFGKATHINCSPIFPVRFMGSRGPARDRRWMSRGRRSPCATLTS
jgi:hypothetical protein